MLAVEIPRSKRVNKKKCKPYFTPEEFLRLVELVAELYSTMICTAVFTGLRVSELTGLRWEDVHDESLSIDERYISRFRGGDWSVTKTAGITASISVDPPSLRASTA